MAQTVSYTYNQGVYQGEYKKVKTDVNETVSIYHGHGTFVFPNSSFSYKGEWVNGKMHGQGEFTTPNFTVIGTFTNGEINGLGMKKWKNGKTFWGNFELGHLHGPGKMTCEDGSIYEGDFQFNQMHGIGRYTNSAGDVFEGKFENNKIVEGTSFEINGNIYEGTWKNSRKNGFGKLKCPSLSYEGEFENDVYSGVGSLKFGQYEYKGSWNHGIRANLANAFAYSLIAPNIEEEKHRLLSWNNKISELLQQGYTYSVPDLSVPALADPKNKGAKVVAKPKEILKDAPKEPPSISATVGITIPPFFISAINNPSVMPFAPSQENQSHNADLEAPLGLIVEESGRRIECKLIIPPDVYGDVVYGSEEAPPISLCFCPNPRTKCLPENNCKVNLNGISFISETVNGVATFSDLCFHCETPGDITVILEFSDVTSAEIDTIAGASAAVAPFQVTVTLNDGEFSIKRPKKGASKKK